MKGPWKTVLCDRNPTSSGSCTSGSVSSKTERDLPSDYAYVHDSLAQGTPVGQTLFSPSPPPAAPQISLAKTMRKTQLVLTDAVQKKVKWCFKDTPQKWQYFATDSCVEFEALCGALYLYKQSKQSTVLHSQSLLCHKHFPQNRKRIYGSNKMCNIFFFLLHFIVGVVSADVVMGEKTVKNIPFLVIYGRKLHLWNKKRGLTHTFVPLFL